MNLDKVGDLIGEAATLMEARQRRAPPQQERLFRDFGGLLDQVLTALIGNDLAAADRMLAEMRDLCVTAGFDNVWLKINEARFHLAAAQDKARTSAG